MVEESYSTDDSEMKQVKRAIALSLLDQDKTKNNYPNAVAGPSKSNSQQSKSATAPQIGIDVDVAHLEAEIKDVDAQIQRLQDLRQTLVIRKQTALDKQRQKSRFPSTASSSTSKGKAKDTKGTVDYFSDFDWSGGLKARMKQVFGINSFRLCQEAVCNANMDSRDIVVVMPTGGGKSLTYQLPALFVPGCTLVISPLVALMNDQIYHLKEAGVEAAMITATTTKQEIGIIERKLRGMASGEVTGKFEIKLLYVTPEKIAKSNSFKSILTGLYESNKFARIVLDEAHCVSHYGHDFRPDYAKLQILRKLFPSVPIMALSATCPPNVLRDLIKILQMQREIVNGRAAGTSGTVYFSAPLYRANLHYAVHPKPKEAKGQIQAMMDYILAHHAGHSGIIYCLSKKETESISAQLNILSKGKIKTGIYHADIGPSEKEQIHQRWRNGQVKVVCATIAFGMGIDKADVRFVLHHSIPKSLDGFYQESGRAGRDGKDADCVLYYRAQDATRIAQLTENDHKTKLHGMLCFAQNLEQCRKVQFANYFSASADVDIGSWTTAEKDALEPCGHCDNCTRAPDVLVRRDVRLPAWRILRIVETVSQAGGQITIAQLADLARTGSATYEVTRRKGKGKESHSIDLGKIPGERVGLSKDDTERLCVHLLIEGLLEEEFRTNSYGMNVYVRPATLASRLTRYTLPQVEQGSGPPMELAFLGKKAKKSARKSATSPSNPSSSQKAKQKKAVEADKGNEADSESLDDLVDDPDIDQFLDDEDVDDAVGDDIEDSAEFTGWSHSMRDDSVPPAKRKAPSRTSGRPKKRQAMAAKLPEAQYIGDSDEFRLADDGAILISSD